MAEVKKRLGSDGDKLQVIFVTLDPDRDTPQVLAQYVPAFDPAFIGLYGTRDETAAVAKDFKVFYQKVPGKTETSYTLDHTAGSYVFDREGRLRLFVRHAGAVDRSSRTSETGPLSALQKNAPAKLGRSVRLIGGEGEEERRTLLSQPGRCRPRRP